MKRTGEFIVQIIFLLGIISSISVFFSLFTETSTVAVEEFGTKASLKKYEWFKDAYNTLEEKRQTIHVYENYMDNIEKSYLGIKRRNWSRMDKEQYNQWSLEIVGLKASYNKVVKEYNSQSNKFNWSLYNTTLPKKLDTYLDK